MKSNYPYPAIYDFSLFPLGLGTTLGWCVKQSIKTIEAGKEDMDVYFLTDDHGPFNIFQPYLNKDNYQVHLLELIWAFYTNPKMRNLYLFQNREDFNRRLEEISSFDSVSKSVVESYRQARDPTASREDANRFLIENGEGHQSILKFYDERGFIPKLISPKGCEQHAKSFLDKIGKDKFIVTTQFRMGALAAARAEDADPTTGSTFSAWYDFFKLAERKFPDVVFLILGKLPEVPSMCLDLKNVIAPRLCGLNLGHELALIKMSDLFLGAASGFCSMAWFTDVPYVITGFNNEKYWTIGYDFGIERCSFANQKQSLVYETESVSVLLKHFGKHYQDWKVNGRSPKVDQERKMSGSVSYIINKADEVKKEVTSYLFEKVKLDDNFSTPHKAAATLQSLESLKSSYTDVVEDIYLYHAATALAFYKINRFAEAELAISKAVELEPTNQTIINLMKMIQSACEKAT